MKKWMMCDGETSKQPFGKTTRTLVRQTEWDKRSARSEQTVLGVFVCWRGEAKNNKRYVVLKISLSSLHDV